MLHTGFCFGVVQIHPADFPLLRPRIPPLCPQSLSCKLNVTSLFQLPLPADCSNSGRHKPVSLPSAPTVAASALAATLASRAFDRKRSFQKMGYSRGGLMNFAGHAIKSWHPAQGKILTAFAAAAGATPQWCQSRPQQGGGGKVQLLQELFRPGTEQTPAQRLKIVPTAFSSLWAPHFHTQDLLLQATPPWKLTP